MVYTMYCRHVLTYVTVSICSSVLWEAYKKFIMEISLRNSNNIYCQIANQLMIILVLARQVRIQCLLARMTSSLALQMFKVTSRPHPRLIIAIDITRNIGICYTKQVFVNLNVRQRETACHKFVSKIWFICNKNKRLN